MLDRMRTGAVERLWAGLHAVWTAPHAAAGDGPGKVEGTASGSQKYDVVALHRMLGRLM
jgi:hypothetical protein